MLTSGMFVADRYEVIERVGAGGMSDVYKAQDHILGRIVAIKVLKAEFSEDMNFVTKFRTEAQSAAGLEHPNIVNIYDVGSQDGLHFIVMEYVEGVTLKTYIGKKGQLTYKEAVSIAIQVGRGIEAAHAKNIIHRDIKPQNILISTDGKAKVTDFGIARAVSNNTISADVMGSVHYASPEQARNGFVDEKSDIYSLGIVMYEMITGRVPYDGETTVAVALGHLQEEMVPPSVYAPTVPISLEKIILKCTQKTLERRYQNMGDLLVDLKKVLVSPNEDFVVTSSVVDNSKTRVISESEIGEIKRAKSVVPIDTSRDTDEVERRRKPEKNSRAEKAERAEQAQYAKSLAEKKRKKYEDKYDDYYDEEDEYDDDDEGALNPSLEKVVTIAGIVTAIIIIIIILYLLGNILGVFGSSKHKNNSDNKADTELVDDNFSQGSQDTGSQDEASNSSSDDNSSSQTENVDDGKVEIPYIVGMSFDSAKEALNDRELGIQQSDSEYSDSYAEGQVISQDIAAGERVDKNTTVKVSISKGMAPMEVPGVVGLDEASAKSTLSDRGFVCGDSNVSYEYSSTVEKGKVISQTPVASSQSSKGATVTIVVSKGQEEVEVPNVCTEGATEWNATQTLVQCGFVATKTEEYSDTIPEGNVISQSVEAGTTAAKGTTINIVVSLGKQGDTYSCKMKVTEEMADADGRDPVKIAMYDTEGNLIKEAPISHFPVTVNETGIKVENAVLVIAFDDGTMSDSIKAELTKE